MSFLRGCKLRVCLTTPIQNGGINLELNFKIIAELIQNFQRFNCIKKSKQSNIQLLIKRLQSYFGLFGYAPTGLNTPI